MSTRNNYKNRVLHTDLVKDPATRGVFDSLNRRLQALEKRSDFANKFLSSPCDTQAITSTSRVKVPKLTGSLLTRGNPVELGLREAPPPATLQFEIAGSDEDVAFQISLLRDDVVVFTSTFSLLISAAGSDATNLTLPASSFRWSDYECPAGQHTWRVEIAVITPGNTFNIRNIQLFGYEVPG